MSFSVDFGNLMDADVRFERAYKEAVREMKLHLDAKAAEARGDHEYVNRTGNLTGQTYCSMNLGTGDEDVFELGSRTPYAVYVDARVLMTIREKAQEAEEELSYLFAGLAAAI